MIRRKRRRNISWKKIKKKEKRMINRNEKKIRKKYQRTKETLVE